MQPNQPGFVKRSKQKMVMVNKKRKINDLPRWYDQECENERKRYYKIKNKLKRSGEKSMSNKETKTFKKLMKAKEKSYFTELNKKIKHLRSNNAKEYWNILNKSTEGKKEFAKLSMQMFLDHFRKLHETERSPPDENTHETNFSEFPTNTALNMEFSFDEIKTNITNLKNNKSGGLDNIINEFLKHAPTSLVSFICDMFNMILDSGIIPEIWCTGLIIPLYKKKGDIYDPDNYRGITLLSCLGKLFTSCLNHRIAKFLYDNEHIGYEQAGFRPEFSTLDHIFTLHTIIEYYKSKNKRIYCAFVDYSKAFDMIDHTSLWLKLLNAGISGKVFNVIHNLYARAKSCVKCNSDMSSFFNCNIGVRQGENLSPILFAIYLNDFQSTLSESYTGLNTISDELQEELEIYLKLFVLLYADDTIILSESSTELQLALNSLDQYCKAWHLKINVGKTKVLIFSKGKVRCFPKFYIDDDEIDVSEEYVYLGTTFAYNGLFTRAIDKQINQARRAMFILLDKASILRLSLDIVLELFDRCVTPILLYGCEVWGWSNITPIEIFHRKFLRQILKTYKFTANCMLYGETGSTDMKTKIQSRMVNFWAKLRTGNQNKLSAILCNFATQLQYKDPDKYQFKWISHVRQCLEETGFSYMWNENSFEPKTFKHVFKQRLLDIFKQNWHSETINNSQCTFYCKIKNNHCFEKYLCIQDRNVWIALTKFKTRTHHLPVTKNRFNAESTEPILCPLCSIGETGDELHYLLECPFFSKQRDNLLPKEICKSPKTITNYIANLQDENDISKLAKFVKIVMSKFKHTITTITSKENIIKKIKISRSGRSIRAPNRLDL